MLTSMQLLSLLLVAPISAQAHTSGVNKMPTPISSQNVAAILSSLGQGTDPSALTSSFNVSDWVNKAKELKTSDIKGGSTLLAQLGDAIKPASFSKKFSV